MKRKGSMDEQADLSSSLAGGIFGLLVGDALGVPYEFHPPQGLPPPAQVEMQPPAGFARSHAQVKPGTWSDDGAQALCLLASLLHCGKLDLDDFGRRLLNWCDLGYFAVGGDVFDIGITTSQALGRLRAGIPAARSGPADEGANGNGALMRVLPLALWHKGGDAELAADARRSSLPTHAHPRSQLCCALYCLWARRLLEGAAEAWDGAVAALRELYAPGSAERAELDDIILGRDAGLRRGSGYVVDCLHSARWAVAQGGYEAAVRAAIGLGHDTDTTACVAGGIAGLSHGVEDIPERWRRALREASTVQPLLDQLIAWRRA
jgi:ADP-ribosylglycohydrolase